MSKCAGFLCSKVTASTPAAAALPGLLVIDFGGRLQLAVYGLGFKSEESQEGGQHREMMWPWRSRGKT